MIGRLIPNTNSMMNPMAPQIAAISSAPRAASAPRASNILFRLEPTNHLVQGGKYHHRQRLRLRCLVAESFYLTPVCCVRGEEPRQRTANATARLSLKASADWSAAVARTVHRSGPWADGLCWATKAWRSILGSAIRVIQAPQQWQAGPHCG